MISAISESQFYMWRTLFAVAHADGIVTDEEISFMAHVLEDIKFTDEQTLQLKDDIINPKDVDEMFHGITSQDDRMQFFSFARDLVWVDGDYGIEEQSVMTRLLKTHLKEMEIEDLVGKVSLEFEEDPYQVASNSNRSSSNTGVFAAFRRRFMEFIGADEEDED